MRTEMDAFLMSARESSAAMHLAGCGRLAAFSESDWEETKAFVGFSGQDAEILGESQLVARTCADEVIMALYGRWLAFPQLRAFFAEGATPERVKGLQNCYFLDLTAGRYGYDYCRDRRRIGAVHRRIGLAPGWYLGAYAIYMEIVLPRVLAAFESNRSKAQRAVTAVVKLVTLDQELMLPTYLGEGGVPVRLPNN